MSASRNGIQAPATFPAPSGSTEIRSLTGLRGTAAVFVVLYHYLAGQHYGGPAANVLLHGYLAVDLFFVLSGFVMALACRHLFAGGLSRAAYAEFLVRRLARIYPVYLAGILCGFVLLYSGWATLKFSGSSGKLLLEDLLLVQTWGLNSSLNFPSWSISAQWATYLLFPLLLLPAFSRRAWVRALTASLAVLALAALCAFSATIVAHARPVGLLNISDSAWALPVVRCVADFVLGLLTCRALQTPAARTLTAFPWAGSVIAAVLLLLLCIPRTDLAVVLLLPPLILSLCVGRAPLARFLETAPLQHLGRISYSLYLVHGFFAAPVNAAATRMAAHGLHHAQALAAGPALLLSLGVAVLAYRWIELPGHLWVCRLFQGAPAGRPAAVTAAFAPRSSRVAR